MTCHSPRSACWRRTCWSGRGWCGRRCPPRRRCGSAGTSWPSGRRRGPPPPGRPLDLRPPSAYQRLWRSSACRASAVWLGGPEGRSINGSGSQILHKSRLPAFHSNKMSHCLYILEISPLWCQRNDEGWWQCPPASQGCGHSFSRRLETEG